MIAFFRLSLGGSNINLLLSLQTLLKCTFLQTGVSILPTEDGYLDIVGCFNTTGNIEIMFMI